MCFGFAVWLFLNGSLCSRPKLLGLASTALFLAWLCRSEPGRLRCCGAFAWAHCDCRLQWAWRKPSVCGARTNGLFPFAGRHPTVGRLPRQANVAPIDHRGRLCLACGLRGRQHSGLAVLRSDETTSELQSLMSISYAVFCLKKKQTKTRHI